MCHTSPFYSDHVNYDGHHVVLSQFITASLSGCLWAIPNDMLYTPSPTYTNSTHWKPEGGTEVTCNAKGASAYECTEHGGTGSDESTGVADYLTCL